MSWANSRWGYLPADLRDCVKWIKGYNHVYSGNYFVAGFRVGTGLKYTAAFGKEFISMHDDPGEAKAACERHNASTAKGTRARTDKGAD